MVFLNFLTRLRMSKTFQHFENRVKVVPRRKNEIVTFLTLIRKQDNILSREERIGIPNFPHYRHAVSRPIVSFTRRDSLFQGNRICVLRYKRKEKLPRPNLNLALANLTSFDQRITGLSLQHGTETTLGAFNQNVIFPRVFFRQQVRPLFFPVSVVSQEALDI